MSILIRSLYDFVYDPIIDVLPLATASSYLISIFYLESIIVSNWDIVPSSRVKSIEILDIA